MGDWAKAGLVGGAAAGTAVSPGVGTVIGGLGGYMLGGMLDGSGGGAQANMYNYDWRAADVAAAQQYMARAQEQSLANALMAQAQGQGPSVAQQQLRMAQNDAASAANAQAASAQGGALGAVLAQRAAIQQQGQANQQGALAAALARNQEQLGAQAQLGNLYGQMRSGDFQQQELSQGRQLGIGDQWQQMEATRQRQRSGEQQAEADKEVGMMGAIGGAAGGFLKGGGK